MLTDKWLGVFVLMAVALGLQLVMNSRQSLAFTGAIHALRAHGKVAVGVGKARWSGGKVFIALAAGPDEKVSRALRFRGITQFARARPAPHYVGMTLAELASEQAIPGISASERAGARQAAQTLRTAGGRPAASGAPRGEERTVT